MADTTQQAPTKSQQGLGYKLKKWLNPVATHDVSDFPGVLIPLGRPTEFSFDDDKKDSEKDSEKDSNSDRASTNSQQAGVRTLASLKADVESDMADGEEQTAYDKKSKVINMAIQDMGMGRYQWELFVLCGFGWLADNLWLQSVALTLPSLNDEFGVGDNQVRYTTMCLFIGLCIGASFWGIMSDVVGRRPAFNATLLIAGVFGLAAGGAPTWVGACALYACIGLGIGGNLPVDGALFLEFLPFASNKLLTLLSAWWPVGTLIASLVAWPFVVNFSCAEKGLKACNITPADQPCCTRADNMGWRYFILTMGAFTFCMFIARFFLFQLFESPKFLLSRGRQAEAVAVVHGIAYKNKHKTWLTEEILNEIGGHPDVTSDHKLSTMEIVRRNLNKFSGQRIGPLFATKKMALSTSLIWFIWTAIGMGYPLFNAFLPQYLGANDTPPNITYRNYAITAVVGIPGSIIAYWTVEIPYIGRKGTMAISTFITGIFLFIFTVNSDPDFQLTFASLEAFFQNIAYGVLYAYTPEVFPAPNRGSGTGIGSFLNRVAGLCAPIVAVNAGGANPAAPIYASGALFFAAGLAMIVLPYETRGRQSL